MNTATHPPSSLPTSLPTAPQSPPPSALPTSPPSALRVRTVPAGTGRKRALAALAAGVMAWLGFQATGVTLASLTGQPTDPHGYVTAQFDGPTAHLDWHGDGYTTAEATFVGDRVAAPGDRVVRTLNVTNDGPSDAVMTVTLLLSETTPATAQNPDLDTAVDLLWDVAGTTGTGSWKDLMARGDPEIVQVPVARGATVPVTIGFEMPASVAGHEADGADSDVLAFTVQVRMRGETAAPVPATVAEPGTYRAPQATTPLLATGTLPRTGVEVMGWVAIAGALVVVGWLLVTTRTKCDHCGQKVARHRTSKVVVWGSEETWCQDCFAEVVTPLTPHPLPLRGR